MRVISDDEVDPELILGGAVSEEDKKKKEEYLNCCYAFVDARHKGDVNAEKEYYNKLLEYLKNFVSAEIDNLGDADKETAFLKNQGFTDEEIEQQSMLFSPEEIENMKKEARDIWSKAGADENYILNLNIISLLCLGLFSKHSKSNAPPLKETGVKVQVAITKPWGNYAETSRAISRNYYVEDEWKGIENNGNFKQIFIVNIFPYLSITDLLSSSFEKNTWFLGFSTHCNYYDGNYSGSTVWGNPFRFAIHDADHFMNMKSNMFKNGSSPFGIEIPNDPYDQGFVTAKQNAFDKLKEFYRYCNETYKKDAQKLYSIKLLLFCVVHEDTKLAQVSFDVRETPEKTKTNIKTYKSSYDDNDGIIMDGMLQRFYNKYDLWGSLPKRIKDKNSDDAIKEYITTECISNFVDALYEFKNLKTGGRRRTKKSNKKRRKSRKMRNRRIKV